MNIEHSKSIPISEILSKLNISPQKTSKAELVYLSPLREEKTPSFYVNPVKNIWYDHGEGVGGDTLAFVQMYLKSRNEESTIPDALRWLKNMAGSIPENEILNSSSEKEHSQEDSVLFLKTARTIKNVGLIHYLEKRGIPLSLAKQYLKELHIGNRKTDSSFYALGFPNENGGFEVRNSLFKGCLNSKNISFIRGRTPKPDSIHLFEGFMDYLSAVTQLNGKKLKGDVIVLNSLSCLKLVLPYIKGYGYKIAYTWMDNDVAGKKATQLLNDFFKTEELLKHVKMNGIYTPHKDVNAWHMNSLGL